MKRNRVIFTLLLVIGAGFALLGLIDRVDLFLLRARRT